MLLDLLSLYVFAYPIATASIWMAGGLLFHAREELPDLTEPAGGWPALTILIPAFNEAAVIETCVLAALDVDYPSFEVIVLDDGSTDGTHQLARAVGEHDPRLKVVRDPANRGKAAQLNKGFRMARNDLVVVTDADTHLHPLALRYLAQRIAREPLVAAVAGAPHVTNRGTLRAALQVLEAASIIGLVRRTQAVTGRVATIAGVLGIFRRDAVLEVGGYDGRMATEDIDLTWRLLIAGWQTSFEPSALVGMQVPPNFASLWNQRRRWARGQGEVLHEYLGTVWRARHWRLWPMYMESLLSLVWVLLFTLMVVLTILTRVSTPGFEPLDISFAVGIAIATISLIQISVALFVDRDVAPEETELIVLGPIFPIAYWLINACAAMREVPSSLLRGPRDERVVWDVERVDPAGGVKSR